MPTLTSLREHGADIVDQVLAENAGRWESASPRDLARVEAVARAVMQRLLHEPTIRLKESGHGRQQVLRELFGLEDSPTPAEAPADKERWVRELDAALLAGDIDCAVHSAKDVPARLADGIAIAAVPERADPRDALCGSSSLAALAPSARVGTSSLRRTAQLRALRPDLEVVALRGNVDTRLRRLAEGGFDAIVLALAGLERLGRGNEGVPLEELVPAAGQGCLAVTTRAGEESLVAMLRHD